MKVRNILICCLIFREVKRLADFYDEMNQLINDILENKINSKETGIRINRIKEKYGEEIFPGFSFYPESKPWDKDYLAKLKTMSITGACSEQFIIHMSEVSDFIYEKKKRKLLFGFIAGVVVLLIIVFGVIFVGRQNEEEHMDVSANVQVEHESENLSTSIETNVGGMCFGNFDQC